MIQNGKNNAMTTLESWDWRTSALVFWGILIQEWCDRLPKVSPCSQLPCLVVIGSTYAIQMALVSQMGSSIPCKWLLLGEIIFIKTNPAKCGKMAKKQTVSSIAYLIGMWHVVSHWLHLLLFMCSIWFLWPCFSAILMQPGGYPGPSHSCNIQCNCLM